MFHVERAFFDGEEKYVSRETYFLEDDLEKERFTWNTSARIGVFGGFLSRNDGFTWNIG